VAQKKCHAPVRDHGLADRQVLIAAAQVSLAAMLVAKQSSVWRAFLVPAQRIKAFGIVQVLPVPQLILPRISSS
jgi:hypothetical protein